jgi:hypothetical protein
MCHLRIGRNKEGWGRGGQARSTSDKEWGEVTDFSAKECVGVGGVPIF